MSDNNLLGMSLDDLFAVPAAPEREPYPWTPDEDEAFRRGAFKRSWKFATRRENNTNPIHADGVMCSTCGYKWHPCEIIKASDGQCFNCWMLDNKPEEVKRFWARVNSNSNEKHGETAPPVLVKLDKKGI